MKRRVLKVGGSLLQVDELGSKIDAWLAAHDDMQTVVVVGGGKVVDTVRELQISNILTEQEAHEMACNLMRVTAFLVQGKMNNASFCDEFDQLETLEALTVVFDSSAWILQQENVSASWNFTSDSIAARLASELDAEELVLLKSRMGSIDEPGFVDACFAAESRSVKSIRVCTLNE